MCRDMWHYDLLVLVFSACYFLDIHGQILRNLEGVLCSLDANLIHDRILFGGIFLIHNKFIQKRVDIDIGIGRGRRLDT